MLQIRLDFGVNKLWPRQNGCHFPDNILKCIFLNDNLWISIKISLKFVSRGPINNIPTLIQIMAWRRPGEKSLSETMMVSFLTHICVTRAQWVNLLSTIHHTRYMFGHHLLTSKLMMISIVHYSVQDVYYIFADQITLFKMTEISWNLVALQVVLERHHTLLSWILLAILSQYYTDITTLTCPVQWYQWAFLTYLNSAAGVVVTTWHTQHTDHQEASYITDVGGRMQHLDKKSKYIPWLFS